MSDKISGEKDGDPVEVYPVWNDGFLIAGLIALYAKKSLQRCALIRASHHYTWYRAQSDF